MQAAAIHTQPPASAAAHDGLRCHICGSRATLFDVVDFNKACSELWGKPLPLAGAAVYYARCEACGFCYAPEFHKWTHDDFRRHIYNEHYIEVDPEYVDVRPKANAALIGNTFKGQAAAIRHLDYGGGRGLLSGLLREAGWNSASYDPFVDTTVAAGTLGVFNLITAFEVFEHVVDPNALMRQLKALLAPGGIVIFSTDLSDGKIVPGQRLTWWYAAPRNGHISLFSAASLGTLARNSGFTLCSFSHGLHAMLTSIPEWATHVFRRT